jgi:hypothetical protein
VLGFLFLMNDSKTSPRGLLGSFISWHFRSRRLEDRIRELCAKAVVTDEPAELNELLAQLASALHEQVDQIRKRVMQDKLAPERRFSRT